MGTDISGNGGVALNAEIANKPLTKSERIRKAQLESRVTESATRMWASLDEIRDRRLYRCDFDDFETYCQETFHFSSNYGRRLATASVTASHIIEHSQTQNVTALITSESQLRPANALEPAEKAQAFDAAAKQSAPKPPTAKHVRTAVNRIKQSPPDPLTNFFKEPIVEPDLPGAIQGLADRIIRENEERKSARLNPESRNVPLDQPGACEAVQADMEARQQLWADIDAAFIEALESECPGLAAREAPSPFQQWETNESHIEAWAGLLRFLAKKYALTIDTPKPKYKTAPIDPEVDNDTLIRDTDTAEW